MDRKKTISRFFLQHYIINKIIDHQIQPKNINSKTELWDLMLQ